MATAGALFVWLFLEYRSLNIAFWIYLLTQTEEKRQQDENKTDQDWIDRLGAKEWESLRGAGGGGLGESFNCINQEGVPGMKGSLQGGFWSPSIML